MPENVGMTAASATMHESNNGCLTGIVETTSYKDSGDRSGDNCIRISEHQCILASSPAPLPSDTPESTLPDVARRLAAEFLGTALLVFIVVSSGIAAENLSADVGIQLLINAFATTAGLYGLITVFGPVSGAHFNPIVSLVDLLYSDMKPVHLAAYWAAQITGGVVGCVVSNFQYKVETKFSDKERFGYELWLSEVIATATLILVIHGCIRTGSEASVPAVVSLWVGGGYFFTSSSIFANPAVTIGRMFTTTFAGIEPMSALLYIVFQILGALLGYGLSQVFYPLHPQALKKDDNLYRRACVLELKDFYNKGAY
jgi:glycerol uptake facilitator-like aquaporin